MARSNDIKTPLGRLAFAQGFWEPQVTRSGKKQYTGTILFPKSTDISALQILAVNHAKQVWGDKAEQMIKDGLIHNPFLDGDGPQGKSKKTGESHAGFPGHKFIRVISGEDYPPKMFNKLVRPATKDDVYSGVWGHGVVNVFDWDNPEKGKGLSFGISMFQATKDDQKLGGGGADPDQYFQPIADEGAAPEETKTGAGAAGLFG
jgi:hypothetical protein